MFRKQVKPLPLFADWDQIGALGVKNWFCFCEKTGRMWVLPIRSPVIDGEGSRWVTRSSYPAYRSGVFCGWGDIDEPPGAGDLPSKNGISKKTLRILKGYEEVVIDGDT